MSVAIIGIGCRFPGGVRSPDDLWTFLLNKGDGMGDMPPERWNLERFYDPDPDVPGRMYTRRAGFLADSLEMFDPEFFGISPREATIMDPQQRLLLEVAQEALDDAGLAGSVAGRSVGVYIGGFTCDNLVIRSAPEARRTISMHSSTSGSFTMLSNRLSFVFDLRGPSMTIDTACSSSLVALHEAVSALQLGRIEMAMVGGVNVMLRPETFVTMCKGHFLAPDGRCKTFDKAADGYARGEGAGVLLLRPLSQALDAGDRIYAVIRATGCNQDGRTPGITVPNAEAQAELIREVTARSGLQPQNIGYIEAHGTGTSVGDPLEMAAIGRTLGQVSGRPEALRVGSIKASIGHLEAAAGIASVIKAALTLHHRTIAPQGWLNELNPTIPFEDYRLTVPREVEAFPTGYAMPAVAVNAFGYGGTNAHAILVAAPTLGAADANHSCRGAAARIFPLSGRNDAGARSFARDLLLLIKQVGSTDEVDRLADAVWLRRAHHPCRFAVSYADQAELQQTLLQLADGGLMTSSRVMSDHPGPVFLLSGMGPQWWGMARGLLAADGAFARKAREIDAIFQGLAGWSLITELLRDQGASQVASARIAQSGNFLLQVSLAAELAELGVIPAAIIGHSVGEVSAAYLSGMLSLEQAVMVSFQRARLQSRLTGTGGMLAVGLPESSIQARLAGVSDIDVAAINSPNMVTLAGSDPALQVLAQELTTEGVFNRLLRVDIPYHSRLMDTILGDLRTVLADLRPREPMIPVYSTLTGRRVAASERWDADYWLGNVRQPVRFADALTQMLADGYRVIVEISPHPVLTGNVREMLAAHGTGGVCLPSLMREQDDFSRLRALLAGLYAVGALDTNEPPGGRLGAVCYHDLPRHRFQRVQLWSEPECLRRDRMGDTQASVFPGIRTQSSLPEWESELSQGALPWLHDHVVADNILLPGAAYLDCALAAAVAVTGRTMPVLDDVQFISPLVIAPHDAPVLRLSVEPGTGKFIIASRSEEGRNWSTHARGRIVDAAMSPTISLADWVRLDQDPSALRVEGAELYERLDQVGLSYGPQFRRVVSALVADDQVRAWVDGRVEPQRHQAHPVVVDCALQCMAAWASASGFLSGSPLVPAAVRSVRQFAPIPEQAQVYVLPRLAEGSEAGLVGDIVVASPDGETALELHGVQFRPLMPQDPLADPLEALWYESTTEPLDEIIKSEAVAPGTRTTLFVVGLGMGTKPWVDALTALSPSNRSFMALAQDPTEIVSALTPVFQDLLVETREPVTVVLCSIGHGETGVTPPVIASYDLDATVLSLIVLAGVATAVDRVLATQNIEGVVTPFVRGIVLTRYSYDLPGTPAINPSTAPLIGARRVLRNEQPSLHWSLLDLDWQATPEQALDRLQAMTQAEPEVDEAFLRDGKLYSQGIQRSLALRRSAAATPTPLTDTGANFTIELPTSRLLNDLTLQRIPRVTPGPCEVEVRLDALELNLKDAMKVIGLVGRAEVDGTYFGMAIGMSGLGVVSRVGDGVRELAVGDTVVFGTRGMAQRYITASIENGYFIKCGPDTAALEVGLMVPLITAQYCVFHAARVQPGEVVLIHGAVGGVGLIAMQACKAAGARIIATASTPERRALALAEGAEFALDSRSINFVEEVRSLTQGRGADVVISSAPGEIIGANLKVAAEFGRVIEIGKRDIFSDRSLSLAPFNRNLTLISVDIDRMSQTRPDLVKQLVREVTEMSATGHYRPTPVHRIPISRIKEAFEMVIRSSHVGRVLLEFGDDQAQARPEPPKTRIHADASYLITGGYGAFGLATANWLAEKGARHLILAGRSGASKPDQKNAIAALRQQGVVVIEEKLDLGDAAAVLTFVQGLNDRLPPLRGVFHAAGVVHDQPCDQLSRSTVQEAISAKVSGGFNLDAALEKTGAQVDYFVLYSSIAAIAGLPSQFAYAGANSGLDALVHVRRAKGMPAISINWGALSGGMAKASAEVQRYFTLSGIGYMDLKQACTYMDQALAMNMDRLAIVDLDWVTWGQAWPASADVLRFIELVRTATNTLTPQQELLRWLRSMPEAERIGKLTASMAEHVGLVLGIPPTSVDTQASLTDLGMDSLMAVELTLLFSKTYGGKLTTLDFARSGGLIALAGRMLAQIEGCAEEAHAIQSAG